MPLEQPNLDDRTAQDLVDEAKRRIPFYCAEWTDHNVSDPGVTLIELFAGMVETLLFRLNRVPEKHSLALMNLIGLQLKPPVAATANLTFYFSTEMTAALPIPIDTEVETAQPQRDSQGGDMRVSFRVDQQHMILPLANPPRLLTEQGTQPDQYRDRSTELDGYSIIPVFDNEHGQPTENDAFYIGIADVDPSSYVLSIVFTFRDVDPDGMGIIPSRPPLRWEAWCIYKDKLDWHEIDRVDMIDIFDPERKHLDTPPDTLGLNKDGKEMLRLPAAMQQKTLANHTVYWIRCLHKPDLDVKNAYTASPQLRTVRIFSQGKTVTASHSETVQAEMIGVSNGDPGQIMWLERTPILDRRSEERIEVRLPGASDWTPWTEVPHFGDSAHDDLHYTLDSITGEVRFGPVIRRSNSKDRHYGSVPALGSQIRIAGYRVGGGMIGNVGSNTLTQLRSSLPYVAQVTNHDEAAGGMEPQSVEQAMIEAPHRIGHHERAVTAEDFTWLAQQASPLVARAHCLMPGMLDDQAANQAAPQPGAIRVLIVPLPNRAHNYEWDKTPNPEFFRPTDDMLKVVRTFLDKRRLLTTVLIVDGPTYVAIRVQVQLRVSPSADRAQIELEATRRLNRYLDPALGGNEGCGLPFGEPLNVGRLYALLQSITGVREVEQLRLARPDQDRGTATIVLQASEVIIPGIHSISIV